MAPGTQWKGLGTLRVSEHDKQEGCIDSSGNNYSNH